MTLSAITKSITLALQLRKLDEEEENMPDNARSARPSIGKEQRYVFECEGEAKGGRACAYDFWEWGF